MYDDDDELTPREQLLLRETHKVANAANAPVMAAINELKWITFLIGGVLIFALYR